MLGSINKTMLFLKNFMFPMRCIGCLEFVESEGLCRSCWSKIKWISNPKCIICGKPFEIDLENICLSCIKNKPYFDESISVFEYDEFSKNIILRFKNYDATYMARQFAKLMYSNAIENFNKADAIVPVPIHLLKRLKRKYNQSELLAMELSDLSGKKYVPDLLKKIKPTSSQEGLTRNQRLKNLKRSFSVAKKTECQRVILVDDVFTTGATLNECSKVLKENGVKHITTVTLAKVVF